MSARLYKAAGVPAISPVQLTDPSANRGRRDARGAKRIARGLGERYIRVYATLESCRLNGSVNCHEISSATTFSNPLYSDATDQMMEQLADGIWREKKMKVRAIFYTRRVVEKLKV